MIAIVLLIAFTVAVGGLISVFLSSFTTTTTGAVQTTATNTTKCAGIFIDLDITSAAIILKNRGTQSISGITCYWGNGSVSRVSGGQTLSSGAMNATPDTRGTQTILTCTGNCLNTGVTGECKSDQACWK